MGTVAGGKAMKWPRGKYNGRLIVGVEIKIIINIAVWRWGCGWNYGMPYLHIGCIHMWAQCYYGSKEE